MCHSVKLTSSRIQLVQTKPEVVISCLVLCKLDFCVTLFSMPVYKLLEYK